MDWDIVVSGGGLAGLITSVVLGDAGHRVLCVEPQPPVTVRADAGADLRTTAILQPGQALLAQIGLWDRLAPHATPLDIMRIVDASDPMRQAIKDFRSQEMGDAPFGWNLPNWLLRRELLSHLEGMDGVTLRMGVAVTGYLGRMDAARLRLSDGTQVSCALAVAADGRGSALRSAAGIPVRTARYGQKALAFAVTHKIPHENVSTEIHMSGGPFTLVPLPDFEGRPSSAVVWMDDGPQQVLRQAMEEAEFNACITERSAYMLGQLELASRRTIWPIISQRAERLTATRLALIAEAAHVVPPIGAQGLNMSLADATTLRDVCDTHPLGSDAMLQAFERARLPDIRLRVAGIDALNRVSQGRNPLLRGARRMGLEALYAAPPVRRLLMQMGLGTSPVRAPDPRPA